MTAAARCPRCGARLEVDPVNGACPVCLLNLALAPASAATGESSSNQGTRVQPAAGSHPQRIGPYRILNVLGQGGMGVVYLAEQDHSIRRKVALKLIKLGMDTREVIARFNTERQALALMSHPNIARVFDAGSSDEGRPYFVMEYVAGIPITDYCDRNRLSTRDRLALFIPVCQAIQHAHQKGVIHRDLKPSNVLVAIEDGRPVAKVIDFGVAKATNQQLTEQTFFTRHGVLLGTPEYMSPEQADPGPLEVDTTTDIYSLGVLLYELLVGVLPFDSETLRKAAHAEVLRIIRDEEPERPSLRVTALGADASEVAKRHDTDVPSLRRQLRGDLDWIVLRALEKDRTRRYASASEFAADIGRHLAGEPVMASPPSLRYRAFKTLSRHRSAFAATGLVFLAIVGGFFVATAMYLRAEASLRLADDQGYVANISAADALLRSNRAAEARTRLAACPVALRGWEWSYLYAQTDASVLTIGAGGTEARNVQFTPDGSRVVWTTDQGVLRAADAATGLPIPGTQWPPPGAPLPPGSVIAVSPDGRRAVVAPLELPIRSSGLFNPSGVRQSVAVLGVYASPLTFVEMNGVTARAGGRFPTAPPRATADDRTLLVLDIASGSTALRLPLPTLGIGSVVWRYPTPVEDTKGLSLGRMSGRPMSAVSAVFSHDGRRVATWTWDKVIRIWDGDTGRLVEELRGHTDGITQAAFASDGTSIVSASYDGTVRIWSTTARRSPRLLTGHEGAVLSLSLSPDGRHVASGGEDKTVRLWDSAGQQVATLAGHGGPIGALAFSPDGARLASASTDRTLRLWEVKTARQLDVFEGHEGEITAVSFSRDGRRLASGSADRTVRIWDLARVRTQALPFPAIGALWSSHGGSPRLLVSSADNSVRVWDPRAPEHVIRLGRISKDDQIATPRNFVTSGAANGDVTRVVGGTADSLVVIWPVYPEAPPLKLEGHRQMITAVAMTADGSRVASASLDRTVRIWNSDTGACLVTIPLPRPAGWPLVFSPDGRTLAAGVDTRVLLWDTGRGQELARMDGHDGPIRSLAYSPDGRLIASGEGSTLRLWDAVSRRSTATLSGHVGGRVKPRVSDPASTDPTQSL
jgi:eukaryotic-like serine/threonine-protein kinase